MTPNLQSMTKNELLKLALDAGHTGISRHTKAQLIDLLSTQKTQQDVRRKALKNKDLNSLSKAELLDLAKQAGLQGISRSTKVDLIALLSGKGQTQMHTGQKATDKDRTSSIIAEQSRIEAHSPAPRHPMAEREPAFATADTIAQEALHAQPEPIYRETPGGPFPERYSQDFLTLLVKDPYWLHAYWEIRPETWHQILERCGEEGKVNIRVYEVTGSEGNGHSNTYFDVEVSGGAQNWYIHGGKPGASFYIELGLLTSRGTFYPLLRSKTVASPRHAPSPVEDEEWMSLPGGYEQIYALSGGGRIGMGSLELREMMERRFREEISSGAVSSFGSGALGRPRERGFWMVVNTELVVYGATEPDATVTVQGHPITLRPDGTFTMRFSLPDGLQEIPVEGTSTDGLSVRTITPRVEKSTTSTQVEHVGV